MWLRDPSLQCTQSTCHHGQLFKGVGVIGHVDPSFPSASCDDRSASQLLSFVQHVDRFRRRITLAKSPRVAEQCDVNIQSINLKDNPQSL
ncbi:hypothetical protein TNCV_3117851 [Trichonephila clavipes]|uniref:Uncharacterized protein n=1 Tax=Trichonephila clavipes TaxID=2585209 RepID=A0A8X6W922_TRICX|nr:hypothetical protein TNCV_3117851 [Trichonephila clavipes]